VDALNQYIERRLNYLIDYANKHSKQGEDIVHEAYIKAVEANFTYINDRLSDVYFTTTIKRLSRKIKDNTVELNFDIAEEFNTEKIVNREKIDEAVRLLPEFDRLLFELYISGVNLTKLAHESGISINTINHSLHRSRKAIKERI